MEKSWKRFVKIMFIVYIAVLLLFVVFKVLPDLHVFGNIQDIYRNRSYGYHKFNLIPFKTIWKYTRSIGYDYAFINLFGNIIPFMPFGFLLPLFMKKKMNFWKTAAAGMAFSLACEITQDLTMTGFFDVDDIILNTLGVMVGYWCLLAAGRIVAYIKKKKAAA